jgi:uncharacterized protein YkwD
MIGKTLFRCLVAMFCIFLGGCLEELFGDDEEGSDSDDWSGDYTCEGDEGDDWPQDWISAECRVLELVNERRAQGAHCGSEGTFPPADPLSMQPQLREAARLHSQDMGERDYFSHDSPDGPNGDDLLERVEAAGYTNWSFIGENIAAGQDSPDDIMDGWMDSPGHCSNIMNPDFTQIGIGYAQVSSSSLIHYWTQDFGTPMGK